MRHKPSFLNTDQQAARASRREMPRPTQQFDDRRFRKCKHKGRGCE